MSISCTFKNNSDVFPAEIVTDRLAFKSVDYETVSIEEMLELYCDSIGDVTEYVAIESFGNRRDAKQYIDTAIEDFNSGEQAKYVITRGPDQDTILGTTSFQPNWDRDIAQSGIILSKRHWGNGYSTERGEAMLEMAFTEFDFSYWISKCHPDNNLSINAIENYVIDNGGRKAGVLPNQLKLADKGRSDVLYFVLSKDDYLAENN